MSTEPEQELEWISKERRVAKERFAARQWTPQWRPNRRQQREARMRCWQIANT